MILRLALEKAGLTIDDVQKVAMDPGTVVTAFASKQIGAAGIWYPTHPAAKLESEAANVRFLTSTELATKRTEGATGSSATCSSPSVSCPDEWTRRPATHNLYVAAD